MSQQEILEGNKLIAEFMGGKFRENPSTGEEVVFPKSPCWDEFMCTRMTGYLKYHKSWDWLMPVVEKIEELGAETKIIGNSFYLDYYSPKDKVYQGSSYEDTTIITVYKGIVKFIKWYNKTKK